MADINTATLPIDNPQQPTISIKENLNVAGVWTTAPNLFCSYVEWRANTWDQAELWHNFGASMRQPGATTTPAGPVQPLALQGKFVRIALAPSDEFAQMKYWYGYVLKEKRDRVTDKNGAIVGRVQRFTVVGLAWFLARAQVRSAFVHDATRLGRPLDFNGGSGAWLPSANPSTLANMHPADDANGFRCFYDPRDTTGGPQQWNHAHALRHLLQYQNPRDGNDLVAPCAYTLDPSADAFLRPWTTTLRTAGRTTIELLQQIASPRRGLQWWGYYRDATDHEYDETKTSPTGWFTLRVQSQALTDIPLAEGGVLPKASLQQSMNYDSDLALRSSDLSDNTGRGYDRVRFRGARQTATFTVGKGDDTLDKSPHWTTDLETSYKDAAETSDGYSGLSEEEKKKRNDAVRREDRFASVFSHLVIPASWNGQAGDGDTAPKNDVFIDLTTAGVKIAAQEFYLPGMRVLPELMIGPSGGAPAKGEEYLKPLVIVQVATSPDKHQAVGKLSHPDFGEGTQVTESLSANYYVFPLSEACGIELRSTSAQHTIAKNHWTDAEPTDTAPELDWETVRATISVEADAFAEGVYPEALSGDTAVNELVVDVGDAYRLDTIAPNTIVGLSEGEPVIHEVQSAYTGTIDVTDGIVTLSSDTWPDWIGPGSILKIGDDTYRVSSRDSDTQLTLQDSTLTDVSGSAFELHSHLGQLIRDDRSKLADMAKFTYQWYSKARNELMVEFSRLDYRTFSPALLVTSVGDLNPHQVNTLVSNVRWSFVDGTTRVQTALANVDVREVLP